MTSPDIPTTPRKTSAGVTIAADFFCAGWRPSNTATDPRGGTAAGYDTVSSLHYGLRIRRTLDRKFVTTGHIPSSPSLRRVIRPTSSWTITGCILSLDIERPYPEVSDDTGGEHQPDEKQIGTD